VLYGTQAAAAQWAATFKDFPPLDEALAKMHEAGMH
jgi:arylsulfatase